MFSLTDVDRSFHLIPLPYFSASGTFCILSHTPDDVNMHQSTNDVIPSAARLTVMDKTRDLLDSLNYLKEELDNKAKTYNEQTAKDSGIYYASSEELIQKFIKGV